MKTMGALSRSKQRFGRGMDKLFVALFVAGAAYSVPYHYLAFDTWRRFLNPPEVTGFGPFISNTIEHVALASVRSASGVMLLLALLLLPKNRRSSGFWALVSAIGIAAFNTFHLQQAFIEYGSALVHNLSPFEIIDVVLAILVAVAACLLLLKRKS